MKQLTDIFNDHRNAMVIELTNEVIARGGLIHVGEVIGGKECISQGFLRKTRITNIYAIKGLFSDLAELEVEFTDGNNRTVASEKMSALSTNEIYGICQAVDRATK